MTMARAQWKSANLKLADMRTGGAWWRIQNRVAAPVRVRVLAHQPDVVQNVEDQLAWTIQTLILESSNNQPK